MTIEIVIMSDRASAGKYKDESGPLAQQMFEAYCAEKRVKTDINITVLADDAEALTKHIQNSKEKDVICISGGTGIGPRDITPETVRPLLDKEIPGIMEMIRVKYGMKFPNALLSRGIAGVMDQSLVYVIPGNPRAVKDYLNEILPTLLHSIKMLKGEGH